MLKNLPKKEVLHIFEIPGGKFFKELIFQILNKTFKQNLNS